jgi:two-component system OmpR family response regulator
MYRLLIAEDDINLAVSLKELFIRKGYSVKVAYTGTAAVRLLRSCKFDLALLDILMPGKTGYEVAEFIRGSLLELPVLFLSSKNEIQDICMGMNVSDGYVVKPFSSLELEARVAALLRRPPVSRKNSIVIQGVRIDSFDMTVKFKGKRAELRKKEFELLFFLARYKGTVCSRDKLINNVWNTLTEPGPGTVDVHISNIRRKLKTKFGKSLISTVHSSGYIINS